jgi:RNA polymerase primary sigma factor
LGVPEKRIDELSRLANLPLSLSEPLGGNGRTLLDLVEDRTTEPSCDAAVDPFTSEIVDNLLSQLDERERRIISLRYGLDGGEPQTYAEVATHFPLTRERIRQIEVKATARLRAGVAGMEACDLLGA